jgi:hypothetical protein
MKKEKTPKIHRQKTYSLTLTKFELLHLRDIMSVLLPPDGQQTLSQCLAEAEGRSLIESLLWSKVLEACGEAGLPVDAEAPDYIIAPTSSPTLGVFHVNHDMDDSSQSVETQGFLPLEDGDQSDDDEEADGDG